MSDVLLDFLDASVTPYHAVAEISARLDEYGYQALNETDAWQLSAAGKYYVVRDNASIIAFIVGSAPVAEAGYRIVGAHTDSPCLRVKPNPVLNRSGCSQLAVEPYGGVLLHTWFDRDLSLAGKVSYECSDGRIETQLINMSDAVAIIPSLAIHLNRDANNNNSVNPQLHLPVVLGGVDVLRDQAALYEWLLGFVNADEVLASQILDFDLRFYPSQSAALIGEDKSLIASARLDNLLSCYIGLEALKSAGGVATSVLVCTDHEEVGSTSYSGAQGPFLSQVLQRIAGSSLHYQQALANSVLISADNAHAVHPNYADKHDGNHAPMINAGPVLKLNANMRYASDAESAALMQWLCNKAEVPMQRFSMRADMACGSTIGPLTAAGVGIRSVDVGVPQWAMHSARETAGINDIERLQRVCELFFALERLPGAK